MAQFGFGQAMRRSEDPRLLTGRADAFAAVDRLLGRLGHREAA